MKFISEEAGRDLNLEESKGFGTNFNNNSIKYIAEGFLQITKEDYSSPLCEAFYCDELTSYHVKFKENHTESLDLTNRIDWEKNLNTKSQNFGNEFYIDRKAMDIATYNCIGWALGISKWISPDDITPFIQEGFTPEQSLRKFIDDIKVAYPKNNSSNFRGIVEKLQTLDSNPTIPTNNTIAFYFNVSEFTHASIYISSVDDLEINSWTSKIGLDLVVSHGEDDLLKLYGSQLYYLDVAENYSNL
jgi:hypothetical protein